MPVLQLIAPASGQEIVDACVLDIEIGATPFSRPHRPVLVVWMDAQSKTVTRWQVLAELGQAVVMPAVPPGQARRKGMVEIWFRNLQIHLGRMEGPLTPKQLDGALAEYIDLYNQIVTELSAA